MRIGFLITQKKLFKKRFENFGYTLFLTLEEQPKNLMLPSNLIKRLINLIYKSLYVIFKGHQLILNKCDIKKGMVMSIY